MARESSSSAHDAKFVTDHGILPADGGAQSGPTRFEALAQLAPVGLFETDNHGWCTYVNERLCEIIGTSPDQLLGRNWTRYVHQDDLEAVLAAFRADVAARRFSRQEFRLCPAGGGVVWALARARPEFDDDGVPKRYFGALTDITAQKLAEHEERRLKEELEDRVQQRTAELRATNADLRDQIAERRRVEESLRASESKWRSLVENAPDFVCLVDREGTITFINRTLPQHTPEEIVGSKVFEYLPMAQHEKVRKLLADVFDGATLLTIEVPSVGEYGARAWYSVRSAPVWSGDTVVAALHLVADITRQKYAEEEARRRREQLAHMARVTTMSELAAVIAHELNSPLEAIINNAQGCINVLQSKRMNRERFSQALEGVVSQANRVGETIRRVQEFLQKREVVRELTAPAYLVQESLSLAEAHIRRHKVAVRAEVAAELPELLVDRIQIEQVLLNLARNAIEAMSEIEGERALAISVDRTDDEKVLFCVSDTGPGLPPGYSMQTFSPFQSTKPQGLGLGLWISQSIVEAHGGRLWADPDWECGARFCLELPTAPPKEVA